ncbi:cell division protein [Duganella sp. Leaf126]|uniref:SPOR domain-containing protein n=1 Tax=Duganella sp. Leaf126 TaxID=1736266 RepID=UPI0006FF88F3|nr:SPOR domain-containing protein [Duganella sp. Leaf126]KQQ33800.1 cell division protein [Duganella sp. Leaf126]
MTLRTPQHRTPAPGRQQQGNTFVGIVIGLVIGLAVAVVVALVINKGASPFTDKARNSKAADTAAGPATDPNKPMYGNKEAARAAAKDMSREPPPAVPAPAPTPAPAKATDQLQAVVDRIQGTQTDKKAPSAANVTPTPTGKAPATPATSPAAGGDEKYIYYLQAGAFREVSDAESARGKLALLGVEATLSDRTTENGVLHRVRIGPFQQVEAMNKVRSKLSENGIDVAVVRNQK